MFEQRIAKLLDWMNSQSISMVVFEDSESHRDPGVRYFSGLPSDGVLLVSARGDSILFPWDINLASKYVFTGKVIPYDDFGRNVQNAVKFGIEAFRLGKDSAIEISERTPYPVFLEYVDSLSNYDVLCRSNGLSAFVREMRETKDETELEIIREGCRITNQIIDKIEKKLKTGKEVSESDIAFLIEKEARNAGCEGLSFQTLAAGPSRSYGIHAFPNFTTGSFGSEGLSILDFGVSYNGYASDVTLTVATGTLLPEQEQQLKLIQEAYELALSFYKAGNPVGLPAKKVDTFFKKHKRRMPHGLGHGIGLEIHESPFVRDKSGVEKVFNPGMVVTLEPGLYHPVYGGCRYENDILIKETGIEVLTASRIIRL